MQQSIVSSTFASECYPAIDPGPGHVGCPNPAG
jgi:hypothetical protein